MSDERLSKPAGGCGTSARGLRGSDAELQMQCAQECASRVYGNPRQLIDALIDYHNKQANELNRLRRALPAEMHPEAEQALYELIRIGAIAEIRR